VKLEQPAKPVDQLHLSCQPVVPLLPRALFDFRRSSPRQSSTAPDSRRLSGAIWRLSSTVVDALPWEAIDASSVDDHRRPSFQNRRTSVADRSQLRPAAFRRWQSPLRHHLPPPGRPRAATPRSGLPSCPASPHSVVSRTRDRSFSRPRDCAFEKRLGSQKKNATKGSESATSLREHLCASHVPGPP
jgi:hypothetical protein